MERTHKFAVGDKLHVSSIGGFELDFTVTKLTFQGTEPYYEYWSDMYGQTMHLPAKKCRRA